MLSQERVNGQGKILRVAGASMDFGSGELRIGDSTERLEPKVAAALRVLARRPGEIVRKDDLMAQVWPDTVVGDDALWRVISELRRVFDDDPAQPKVIETLARRGYRLLATVEEPEGAASSIESTAVDSDVLSSSWLRHRSARWAAGLTLGTLMTVALSAHRSFDGAAVSHDEGDEAIQRALAYAADHPEARSEDGWTAAGLDASLRAAAAGPRSLEAKRRAAEAMISRGRISSGLEIYKSALATQPSTEVSERARRLEAEQRRRAEAIGRAYASGDLPADLDGALAFARELRLLERHDEARQLLKNILREHPGELRAIEELTVLDLTGGSLQGARTRIEETLGLYPDSIPMLNLAAELELVAGHREQALGYLDRACLAQRELDLASEGREASVDDDHSVEPDRSSGNDHRARPMLCWSS